VIHEPQGQERGAARGRAEEGPEAAPFGVHSQDGTFSLAARGRDG
jgi:hypothetical protein